MKKIFYTSNHTIIETDPLSKFPGVSPEDLIEACGFLPQWADVAFQHDNSFKEALLANYAYYGGPMEGGTVTEEGVYQYPGDPDLYPLVAILNQGVPEVLYIYQYGIVATVSDIDGVTWVTRMD